MSLKLNEMSLNCRVYLIYSSKYQYVFNVNSRVQTRIWSILAHPKIMYKWKWLLVNVWKCKSRLSSMAEISTRVKMVQMLTNSDILVEYISYV
jgi:predicted nucleic acid-binding OB-fold protein